MTTCTLVLIVRNEAENIKKIGPLIPLDIFDDCFAVDGRSTDNTVKTLEALGIKTYSQTQPGLGAAMIECRDKIKTDTFIFFHPDGNEDPADLPKMVSLLKAGHPFVVASRMVKGARNEEDGRIFKLRKYANVSFTGLANVLFGRNNNRASDAINGFRGVSREAFDRMKLSSLDLTIDYQMIIRALRFDIPITEFPTIERPRLNGSTNFKSVPAGIAELKLLGRELRAQFLEGNHA